jgi:hypothetical protein
MLAHDAVRGEARDAQDPVWWETVSHCDVPVAPSAHDRPPVPRIVYDANDGVARDIAERFVGLARTSDGNTSPLLDAILPDRPRRTFQQARGLTGAALTRARRRGGDAGYVVPLETRPLDPCRDLQALLDTVPWLDAATIVPLVEVRPHAIVRRGAAGVRADWDGGLLIVAPRTP